MRARRHTLTHAELVALFPPLPERGPLAAVLDSQDGTLNGYGPGFAEMQAGDGVPVNVIVLGTHPFRSRRPKRLTRR